MAGATIMFPIRVAVMGHVKIMLSDRRREPRRIRPDENGKRNVANMMIVIVMVSHVRSVDGRRKIKHQNGQRNQRDLHRSKPIELYRRQPFRQVSRTAMVVTNLKLIVAMRAVVVLARHEAARVAAAARAAELVVPVVAVAADPAADLAVDQVDQEVGVANREVSHAASHAASHTASHAASHAANHAAIREAANLVAAREVVRKVVHAAKVAAAREVAQKVVHGAKVAAAADHHRSLTKISMDKGNGLFFDHKIFSFFFTCSLYFHYQFN